MIGFFNILFDADFENANYSLEENYPGIDIVDFNKKAAMQITSENNSEKILDTVRMIRERELYKEFHTFYIYILSRKKSYRNLQERIDKITGKLFSFHTVNIYDAASVYVYLNRLGDKNKIEAIRQYLEEWFGQYNQSLSDYPEYLTDIPDGIVPSFTGRTEIIREITGLLESGTSVFLSAVGGLGKTEVARSIMKKYADTPTTESGIYYLGWVRYDNNDLRSCIKSAFRLKGAVDEAWNDFRNMAQENRDKMFVVIDNIESADRDEYLGKLSNLPCRLLVTGRCRTLSSLKVMELPPLNMDECRNIFYYFYHFKENNEILNDVINLTCRLTIMVEFLAKVAQLEELSLQDLYGKLVELGFKLSQEDVSGNHEKLRSDHTIIEQMCLLFSFCAIDKEDQKILTWISIIPSIPFTRKNAGDWFGIQKNSTLKRLFDQGLLEIEHGNTTHKYWMHSVIAAAIREQKKNILYDETRPFIERLSEELDFGSQWGQGYKKEYLIPFSWSVSDILEDHWNSEADVDFLTRLYYVTFESGNYVFCRKLIEQILGIDLNYYKRAEDIWEKVLPENSVRFMEIHQCRGECFMMSEQYDKAIAEYTQALNLLSSQIWPRIEMTSDIAECYLMSGDLANAGMYFVQTLKDLEEWEEAEAGMQVRILLNLCAIEKHLGNRKESEDYYKRAFQEAQQSKDSELISIVGAYMAQ